MQGTTAARPRPAAWTPARASVRARPGRRLRAFASATLGLSGALAIAALTAPLASAHDAPMALGDRHGHLAHEPWVMTHWLPFDEAEAEQALGLPAGQLAAFLYNDHHTLAQLAVQRKVAFEPLVSQLAAWSSGATAEQQATIKQRIRLVLVSGHLAQHVIGHVFHGSAHSAVLIGASGLSSDVWSRRRSHGWSYARLIEGGGGDVLVTEMQLRASIANRQAEGVTGGETPGSQGDRLAARQNGLLHCWLTRPSQRLDPAAPYGRRYLKHASGHRASEVPTTRTAQRSEDIEISRGLAGRPASCWDLPAPFRGDPGAPLRRDELRRLARVSGSAHDEPNHAMHANG